MTTNQIAPIQIVDTGTVLLAWRHPYRKSLSVMMTVKGHVAHCLECDQDVSGTKPHTRRALVAKAIMRHICSHDRRKVVRESGWPDGA